VKKALAGICCFKGITGEATKEKSRQLLTTGIFYVFNEL
jgi:hypothetical protein